MLTCLQYTTKHIIWQFTITQLCKHITSQFDDWLIIGYGKTMSGFKKI